ncbi:MAG: dephospho-CoA kinase [Planctomycetes bacterium]|nr:dephospho-CoA kinase [Planctomycetota bacterium]
MKTIGLVGGVASGKSRVAQMLVELGAGLLDADRTAHEVLAGDPEVRGAIRQRWGDSVLAADGSIDRAAVASRVFGPEGKAAEERRFLEELLHPRVRQRLETLRQQFAAEGRPAVVLDAPLLLEAGWGSLCDVIVMVDASRDVRLGRACRRGWTETEFVRREAAQWPVARKRRHADVVIKNDGSEEALRTAVRGCWHTQVAPSPTGRGPG